MEEHSIIWDQSVVWGPIYVAASFPPVGKAVFKNILLLSASDSRN